MSGHNKWSTIKHKKAAADAKRGKEFSRLAKELILAAKLGGKDPELNPRLRTAVAAAKAVNMPNDNIDRAIKKGAGELGGETMDELCYECYAPGGVAFIIDCLTDNHNRTAADVRMIVNKGNGNMAGSGSVAYMFNRKARFVVTGTDEDSLMELCLEAELDLETIEALDDEQIEIIGAPEAYDGLVELLEKADIKVSESSVVKLPDNWIPVTDVGVARQVLRLTDQLEDYDDVQAVYSNADISDEIMEQLAAEE